MDQVLKFLSQQLNTSITTKYGLSSDLVTVGRLINQDGSVPDENDNKLLLALVNLTTETSMGANDTRMGFAAGGFSKTTSPLNLSMNVLVAAHFIDELESLKFLSDSIDFFHAHPQFDKGSAVEMPANVEKITLETVSLSLRDHEALWGAMGAKAIPSVLYKIRFITINP